MAKIIVVDDESMYCQHLSQMLGREGHEVRIASSGSEAIEQTRDFEPDLLITDWMLAEDMTGLHVSEKLQQIYPRLKTIVITGFLSTEPAEQNTGTVFRFVEKPFGIDEIRNAVREALA